MGHGSEASEGTSAACYLRQVWNHFMLAGVSGKITPSKAVLLKYVDRAPALEVTRTAIIQQLVKEISDLKPLNREGYSTSLVTMPMCYVLALAGAEASFSVCSEDKGTGLLFKKLFEYKVPKTITAPINCSALSG